MFFKKIIPITVLSLSLNANELLESIKFNGFGTIGTVYNDNENFTYRNDFLSNTGSSNNVSLSTNTKIGGQINIDITDNLTGVVQASISQKEKNTLNESLDWANIKYEKNENINFKLGRMRAPMFMYSDISKVSYAYPWINPPIEVYSPIPFTSYNGGEIELKQSIKEWDFSSQVVFGANSEKMYLTKNESTDFNMENYKGLVLTASNDTLKLRVSYSDAKVKMDSNSLNQLSTMLINNGYEEISTKYLTSEQKFTFLVGGINYENENYFLTSEYATYTSTGGVDKYKGGYISGGYHLSNNITPYITISKSIQKNRDIKSLVPNTGTDMYLHQSLENMEKIYNISQKSETIGIRWDFHKSATLKGEFQYIKTSENSNSLHFKENNQKDLNVFALSLDFLF